MILMTRRRPMMFAADVLGKHDFIVLFKEAEPRGQQRLWGDFYRTTEMWFGDICRVVVDCDDPSK